MKTLTVALLAAALAAQPAPEDPGGWNVAKWGMTEDEVLAALPGQAARLPGPHKDGTASVAIEHLIIAGHDFRVTFVPAKSGGLIRVAVMPTEKNPAEVVFQDLQKALAEQHRAPASSQSNAGWISFAAGREVGFPDDLGRVDPHVQPRHQKFRDPAALRTEGRRGEPATTPP